MESNYSVYLYDYFNNEEEALEWLLVRFRAKEESKDYVDTHLAYLVGEIVFTEKDIDKMKEYLSIYFYT